MDCTFTALLSQYRPSNINYRIEFDFFLIARHCFSSPGKAELNFSKGLKSSFLFLWETFRKWANIPQIRVEQLTWAATNLTSVPFLRQVWQDETPPRVNKCPSSRSFLGACTCRSRCVRARCPVCFMELYCSCSNTHCLDDIVPLSLISHVEINQGLLGAHWGTKLRRLFGFSVCLRGKQAAVLRISSCG